MDVRELLAPRVLLVTGKGGVGKSTVAATLAVAAAGTGRRTCLVEVEGRQSMRSLFATEPWDFDEREFRPGLFGMSIDPEASLRDYMAMFYGARRLSRLVINSTAVEFATTAAPGIKDVLLIGKVKEMERRRDADGHMVYDSIVVDAPPTGRIVNFLRAPDAATELVTVGPIREQAQSVVDLLCDPARLRVQLVTLLEEMPVTETVDSAQALSDLGVALNPVIANRVLAPRLDSTATKLIRGGLESSDVAAALTSVDADADAVDPATLLDLADRHLRRLDLQDAMRGALTDDLGPAVELPFMTGRSFGEAEINRLADTIAGAHT